MLQHVTDERRRERRRVGVRMQPLISDEPLGSMSRLLLFALAVALSACPPPAEAPDQPEGLEPSDALVPPLPQDAPAASPGALPLALLVPPTVDPCAPAPPADAAPPPPPEPPPTDLFPEGRLLGVVVDGATGETRAGVPVAEMVEGAPNAVLSQPEGDFNIAPRSWEPAQVWTQPEGSLGVSVAVDEGAWKEISQPLRLELVSMDAGVAQMEKTTGMPWPDGVGVVRLRFHPPRPQDAEGLSASLSSEALASFVVDAAGATIPGHTIVADAAEPSLLFAAVPPGPTTIQVKANPGMVCRHAGRIDVRPRMIHHIPVHCGPDVP